MQVVNFNSVRLVIFMVGCLSLFCCSVQAMHSHLDIQEDERYKSIRLCSQSSFATRDNINALEILTMSVDSLRHFTCGESAAIGERMFRCQLCESVVPAGTRSSKIILVTRDKTYNERGGGGFSSSGGFRKRGPSRGSSSKKDYDKGGEGQEIVREATVCPKCAAEHQRQLDLESSNTNEGAE